MGAKYSELKTQNAELRSLMEGFAAKMKLEPGSLVVFTVAQKFIGVGFGLGWSAMDNMSKFMSQLAGGPVRCMATTDKNPFAVDQLDNVGRAKLRALLDQLDQLALPSQKEAMYPKAIATPR